ncbi:Uma2 family endonuclease [Fulvimarina sp. MAC3]|uniref:Uma2 family endonuclease n=1 Tax=Fulvimarina sp. MAC3 TaxID=3148887 RepID=UPI0031FBBE86
MSEAATNSMTLSKFLDWEKRQERKFEFVAGEPRMMTGGTQAHALIGANIQTSLHTRLRGNPSRVGSSDLRVTVPATGNSRYPVVTVDCEPYEPASHDASKPPVVFEALSKSTAWCDQSRKLRDYETVRDIRQYVCGSQSESRISVWTRDDQGRFLAEEDITEEMGELQIEPLGMSVPISEIYDGTGLGATSKRP